MFVAGVHRTYCQAHFHAHASACTSTSMPRPLPHPHVITLVTVAVCCDVQFLSGVFVWVCFVPVFNNLFAVWVQITSEQSCVMAT